MTESNISLWAVLILAGAVHGFFLAFSLQSGKSKRVKANFFLSMLLLVIALHLVEYGLSILGLTLKWPHIIAVTFPLIYLMGPLYYFYSKSLIDPSFRLGWKESLHFIPALLVLLAFMPFYAQSGQQKIDFMMNMSADGLIDVPPEQFVFMGIHALQTLIYALLAWRNLKKAENLVTNEYSGNQQLQFKWLKTSHTFFTAFLITYLISVPILFFADHYRVEMDYAVVLLLAVLIYAIGYAAMKQPQLFLVGNGKRNKNGKQSEAETDRNKKIADRVLDFLETEKVYLNEDLKMSDMAEALDIPAHQLSSAINNNLELNFFDLINKYRVNEAKQLLTNPDHADLKILAIAFESGFSNKATFNRAFKKFTGQPPSHFRSH